MQPLTTLLIVLLFLTGLIGGGVGIREFKLPWAGSGVRTTAVVASLLLWFTGSALQRQKRIEFSVTNNLSQNILREQAILSINEQEVGSIESSTAQPNATVEFSVKEAGTYRYFLTVSVSYINSTNGQEEVYNGVGSGTIEVESGDTFRFIKNYQISPPVFSLEE